jgi:signal transduction histidine kinase
MIPRWPRANDAVRTWALATGYVVAYVALDRVSYVFPIAPFAITPWNPPAGLSLAFLLLAGLHVAPALAVAAVLADVLVRGGGVHLGFSVLSSVIIAACYTGVAAFLLRAARIDPALRRLRDVAWIGATAVPASLVVAGAYVGLHAAAGLIPRQGLATSVLRFWIGDMIGIIVTTPALLAFVAWRRSAPPARPGRAVETAGQAAATAAALAVVLWLGPPEAPRFFYLLFPPIIWIALRRGLHGTIAAILAVQVVLIGVLYLRHFPEEHVLEFQFLMLSLAFVGLFLGITVTERARGADEALRDVSQRLATEEKLRAKEDELASVLRFAAAGQVASSLAHELNQPLYALSTYVQSCQLIASRPDGDPALLAELMAKAVREVERAGDVVKRLREFFQTGAIRFERIAVRRLLEGAAEASRRRTERHRIALSLECAEDLGEVACDALQIEIVLHNLVGNAIDAIESGHGALREVRLSARAGDGQVEIRVEDTGPGITDDVAARLFEPFTTSKPEGMGLGLVISRYIVEAHGGRLWAEPLAAGCAFCLSLPRGTSGPNDA